MPKLVLAALFAGAFSTQALAQAESVPPYTPEIGPRAGDYELIISGSGNSSKNFETNTFGSTVSLGWYWTENVQVGFRQSFGFGLVDGGRDIWNGRSVVAVDYVFDFGRWRPFIGAFVGGVYGKDVDDDGVGGLEAGLKWYANESTFIQGSASYGPTFTQGFDNGDFQYTVGVGFNF
jgi:hypothetical protein